MTEVGAGPAFVAGVASFLSPCVLPLVPGYISMISGLELEELSAGADKSRVLRRAGLGSLFFVLGFSLVFSALGASATEIGRLLAAHMALVSKVAGIVIVIFGLHTSGVMPIKWLYVHKRVDHKTDEPTLVSAFIMGLAFACGWTPCIGPILASILALAATEKTVAQGVVLLLVYSAGLGVPFILTGLGVEAFLAFFKRYKRYIRAGEMAAGALLVAVGVLVFFNRLTLIIQWLPHSLFRFAL